jgi:hypothetical protein
MNLNSKYFDMIRASRGREEKRAELVEDATRCDWPDCTKAGSYPAPSGPQANERRNFCYDHVREYNRSYNYFEGMSQTEAESFRRAAQTGHRPTWSMGTRRARGSKVEDWQFQDPLEIMGEAGFAEASAAGKGSKVTSGQKRALDVMDLPATAKAADVSKKFKILVKQYHPDANGGDRSHEDELQSVIQAHDYLKASGFC